MRTIEQDHFSRRKEVPQQRRHPSFLGLALLLVSVALLVLSRVEHNGLKQLRWHLAESLAPVLSVAAVPLEPVRWIAQQAAVRRDLIEENARLTYENQRLGSFQWRAQELERRMASLSLLARVVEQSTTPFVTARVIADSGGPFARAVMISAGKQQGIKPGSPVIGATGLVGRIVDTGQRASRVLLLADQASRIPVQIGKAEARAILAGDGSGEPKLQMLAPGAMIAAGDDVSTSGTGGQFPRGLLIGRVVGDVSGFRVAPHARLDGLDYVSVLLTELPALDLVDELRVPVDAASRRAQVRGAE